MPREAFPYGYWYNMVSDEVLYPDEFAHVKEATSVFDLAEAAYKPIAIRYDFVSNFFTFDIALAQSIKMTDEDLENLALLKAEYQRAGMALRAAEWNLYEATHIPIRREMISFPGSGF
jgi:hypothetical protein